VKIVKRRANTLIRTGIRDKRLRLFKNMFADFLCVD
jgi:hypothetical protein